MSAESEEVTIEFLYVYLKVWRALCTIYQHRYISFVRATDDFFYRIDGSQNIADMCNTDQSGA